ncbi:SAM-dependent methyltransferase [Crossiella equi]|uniref:SAM-dependent methyltransferase n=1 Tax=Crossiella equi TaxID=130796 RepID=A0ABS5A9G8_9PSEU|nr:class I SAM-dependent methyltransferase [Crossiella equi]MBP2473216.1 SAM-dependent methyltransferase [Crossiella equi]
MAVLLGDRRDPAIVVLGGEPDFCARLAGGLRFVISAGWLSPGLLGQAGVDRAFLVDLRPPAVAPLAPPEPGLTPVVLDGSEDDPVAAVLRATSGGWSDQADRLAHRAIAGGTPTAWFEQVYRAGLAREVDLPWDRTEPQPLLVEWAAGPGRLPGEGRGAVVCGCGLGADAEYIASLGFRTTAFDISPTAVALARARHPGSPVRYLQADLFSLPDEWARGFDLVLEVFTVQALTVPVRAPALRAVGGLVAPGGTLLVIATAQEDGTPPPEGPPWPLPRAELEHFAATGLDPRRVELLEDRGRARWRAEFGRAR